MIEFVKELISKYRQVTSNYLHVKLDKLVISRYPDPVIKRYNEIVKEIEEQSFYVPILDNKTLFDAEFYTLLCTRRQELVDDGTLVVIENHDGFAVKYKAKCDISEVIEELQAALIIRCVIHHRSKHGNEPVQEPWGVE